jgi:hypothetical protein
VMSPELLQAKWGLKTSKSGISTNPRPHPPRCVGMLINGTDKGNLHLFDYLHFAILADSIHPLKPRIEIDSYRTPVSIIFGLLPLTYVVFCR